MNEFVITETQKIRQMIFDFNIEPAIDLTIALMERLIVENKNTPVEQKINYIMPHLMNALECKDYLLFADIVSFEIPNVFAIN